MMIRNVVATTLATFTALFASSSLSSAVVSATTEHSSIRGSSASAPDSSKNDDHRTLIGLDEMVCEPTDDGQGSVVCTFRMVPPSTTDNINQYNYCMSDGNGDEFCLKTEVFRKVTPRADDSLQLVSSSVESYTVAGVGDNTGYTIETPVETPPVAPTAAAVTGVTTLSTAMNCPRNQPASRSPCGGWLLAGSNYGSCLFGRAASCNCNNRAGHEDAKNIYWICDGDGLSPMAKVEDATIDITANVYSIQESAATAEAAAQAAATTAGTINVPRPINDIACPIVTPVNGNPCVRLKRCGYWDHPETPTKLIDCRCDTFDQFVCRDADQALYGFYYSSF